MPPTFTNQVILRDEADWGLWIYSVKQIANSGRVWEYINPELPYQPLNKPEKPERPAAAANSTASSINSSATAAPLQATTDDFTRYNQDLLYFIKDQNTIYDQLKLLQERYSPTTVDREYRIQKAYETAKILKAETAWSSNRQQPIPDDAKLSTILAEFLRYCRIIKLTKANIHGGAFGATLNNEMSPYKRKRQGKHDKATRPCLCGDIHFWGQCPYID
ncbi:hypothetical protein GQ43DRAFT_404652, partial [Delitschia confertaspora ATCC 74209]